MTTMFQLNWVSIDKARMAVSMLDYFIFWYPFHGVRFLRTWFISVSTTTLMYDFDMKYEWRRLLPTHSKYEIENRKSVFPLISFVCCNSYIEYELNAIFLHLMFKVFPTKWRYVMLEEQQVDVIKVKRTPMENKKRIRREILLKGRFARSIVSKSIRRCSTNIETLCDMRSESSNIILYQCDKYQSYFMSFLTSPSFILLK